jgi:hypothetical protein
LLVADWRIRAGLRRRMQNRLQRTTPVPFA